MVCVTKNRLDFRRFLGSGLVPPREKSFHGRGGFISQTTAGGWLSRLEEKKKTQKNEGLAGSVDQFSRKKSNEEKT